jgi:hypothetical protein
MTTTWLDITIAIPSMPQRSELLARLVARLTKECEGARILARVHRDGEPPRLDFPALIAEATSVERPWILQMEDDAWPAPVFGVLVPSLLQEASDRGVSAASFFSRHKADLEAMRRGDAPHWRSQGVASLCMIQAIAVRRATLLGLSEWAPSWYAAHPEHIHAADLLLGAWLSTQRAKLLVRVPSMVQHLAVSSTLPNHRGTRQSDTYRWAFGEAP